MINIKELRIGDDLQTPDGIFKVEGVLKTNEDYLVKFENVKVRYPLSKCKTVSSIDKYYFNYKDRFHQLSNEVLKENSKIKFGDFEINITKVIFMGAANETMNYQLEWKGMGMYGYTYSSLALIRLDLQEESIKQLKEAFTSNAIISFSNTIVENFIYKQEQ